MATSNCVTRQHAVSGLVADLQYGRLAHISAAAGTTVKVHDGPAATDSVVHDLIVPATGVLEAPCGCGWRFPQVACWVAVSAAAQLTFR